MTRRVRNKVVSVRVVDSRLAEVEQQRPHHSEPDLWVFFTHPGGQQVTLLEYITFHLIWSWKPILFSGDNSNIEELHYCLNLCLFMNFIGFRVWDNCKFIINNVTRFYIVILVVHIDRKYYIMFWKHSLLWGFITFLYTFYINSNTRFSKCFVLVWVKFLNCVLPWDPSSEWWSKPHGTNQTATALMSWRRQFDRQMYSRHASSHNNATHS